jgi:hypothetical protein
MKVIDTPSRSQTKSSAKPSIVLPLRATVKLLVSNVSAPSAIITRSPAAGEAGSVSVKEPPEVSATAP